MSSDEVTQLREEIKAVPAELMVLLKPHIDMLREHDSVLYGANKDDGLVTDIKEANEVVRFIKGAGGRFIIGTAVFMIIALLYLIAEHPNVIVP